MLQQARSPASRDCLLRLAHPVHAAVPLTFARAANLMKLPLIACALLVVLPLASSAGYCWLSNYDDKIHVENMCVNSNYETSLCLQRAYVPSARIIVTSGDEFTFPKATPNIDVAIVQTCSDLLPTRPYVLYINMTCNRKPLCVADYYSYVGGAEQVFQLNAPQVYNAPPRAQCALRSDVPGELGLVVNRDITNFNTSYMWNSSPIHGGIHGPSSINITFYTNRACTDPLDGPEGTIGCEYNQQQDISYYFNPCL